MKAAVLGGGAWGTALACQLARCGHEAIVFVRDRAVAREIASARTHSSRLPGVALPAGLHATGDLAEAVGAAELIVAAVPSHGFRDVLRAAAPLLPAGAPVVSATKGLETLSLCRMSEIVGAELPGRPLAVLSGPSFALEVAREQPTAMVLAAADAALAERLQQALSSRAFRVYASDDLIGVELGGALKNVIAIAAGVVDGLGYGHNTLAALVTRGLAEISRLALACGGRAETLAGLAGIGDLVLTCTGALSRNRTLGQQLGRGLALEPARALVQGVAEGVRTTEAACTLAARGGIEMPIAIEMRAVLYEGKAPRAALDQLMLRTLKRE